MSDGVLRALALLTAAISAGLALSAIVMFSLTPDLDLLVGWGFAGYDA